MDVSGRRMSKPTRRAAVKKNMANTTETQQMNNSVSMISQRPRRQVKHKFIKSANTNVTAQSGNSVASSDVSDESTSLLSTLSPNSNMRLVPMLHRLPMNTSKLNWQDIIGSSSTDAIEMDVTSIEPSEPGTSNTEETETELNNKLNNSKRVGRKARQLRQTVCPEEPTECNSTSETNDEDVIERTTVAQNTVIDNNLTSGKNVLFILNMCWC